MALFPLWGIARSQACGLLTGVVSQSGPVAPERPGLACNRSPVVPRSIYRASPPAVLRAVPGPPGNYRIPTGLAVDTTAILRVFSQSSERLC